MSLNSPEIIVVGAGLGGLAATLALARAGFRVTVLEQAAELGKVGAGVQISANGARVLHHLGLADALAEVAFTPERGEVRHWKSGETLSTRPLGQASLERFGFPYYHLHRADFHGVLVDAVRRAAPDSIRLGAKVVGLETVGGRVAVRTESGQDVAGDVVVGADGIHSTIREAVHGRLAARFTGCVAWRATVPPRDLPEDLVRPDASNWIGVGGHFVHYYLRRGALVNCVGVMERDAWHEESWSAVGERAEFLRVFDGWHADIQTLIHAARRCFRWGLFDRDPLPAWSDGPVTLLGDACHAMLPFMAQGAVMALEDAHTLAACLEADGDDPPRALKRYEMLRLERTATVQAMSRDNISFFHDAERGDIAERLDRHREAHLWLYGFDVTAQDFGP